MPKRSASSASLTPLAIHIAFAKRARTDERTDDERTETASVVNAAEILSSMKVGAYTDARCSSNTSDSALAVVDFMQGMQKRLFNNCYFRPIEPSN